MGAHSWIQAIAQFARVDVGLLVRTVGGLVGLLLTLSVYVAVRWAGGRRGAAVAATAMYGVFIYSGVLPAEAWRNAGLAEPYPSHDLVELYAARGGKKIALGSDAHQAGELCQGFQAVWERAEALGLELWEPRGYKL